MTTFGKDWRQQVSGQLNDLVAFQEHIAEREKMASEWIESVMGYELEEGIASCISRESDSLALQMPTTVVLTAAFRKFMVSLEEKDLLVDVALDGETEGESYLLVSPAV